VASMAPIVDGWRGNWNQRVGNGSVPGIASA